MSEGGLPAVTRERLRALPSVESVLVSEAGRAALQIHPRPRVLEAIRRVLGSAPDPHPRRARRRASRRTRSGRRWSRSPRLGSGRC